MYKTFTDSRLPPIYVLQTVKTISSVFELVKVALDTCILQESVLTFEVGLYITFVIRSLPVTAYVILLLLFQCDRFFYTPREVVDGIFIN